MTSYTSVSKTPASAYPGTGVAGEAVPASSVRAPGTLKPALVYLLATVFCAFFGAVYELFSHEVYSYFMIYAFALPLVMGALPNVVIALAKKRAPGKRAANAWNSGVATLTVGCLFQGALEIYGTTNQLSLAYPIVGALLCAAGVVLFACELPALAKRRCETPEVLDERQAARPVREAVRDAMGTPGTPHATMLAYACAQDRACVPVQTEFR